MGKNLFITEKPSVAMEFAKALSVKGKKQDGYIEDDDNIITWCVGHLITLSFPEAYDPSFKQWQMETLPFLPEEYKYEPISNTEKQYKVVKKLLNRKDVSTIYYSGDSAREGEYIQRLVRMMAGHNPAAEEYRVWIDSQTYDEIRRGIKEAKPLSAYDLLSESAYARAIEDYAVGINFSRAVSLKYSKQAASSAGLDKTVIAVGRVMSCVLGMTVKREREIRNHVKTDYFGVSATIDNSIQAEWSPKNGSQYYSEKDLYNASGFVNSVLAKNFISVMPDKLLLYHVDFKNTKKQAPLLFNLAELQSECTKKFHISPSDTLQIAQTLYEKKLTTYPRTDARVLTSAVAKEIHKNIKGLQNVPEVAGFASNIISGNMWTGIKNTKYVNDAAVSDHYALIPTGNTTALSSISALEKDVYLLICRRFLSIFYPAAEYEKAKAVFSGNGENFQCGGEELISPGWLEIAGIPQPNTKAKNLIAKLKTMNKGTAYPAEYRIDAKETKPPTRYTTGSMILAMENAGKLIEDEELREQIKGSGIGTSATRAETIKKLIKNGYIQTDKGQVISPTFLGEIVYESLDICIPQVLSPDITANWERGLSQIENGTITREVYIDKLNNFVTKGVNNIKTQDRSNDLSARIREIEKYYPAKKTKPKTTSQNSSNGLSCPKCGKPLNKLQTGNYKGSYVCSANCGFKLWNSFGGKKLSDHSLKSLIQNGETDNKVNGLKSKSGKEYSAKLSLMEDGKIKPVFE